MTQYLIYVMTTQPSTLVRTCTCITSGILPLANKILEFSGVFFSISTVNRFQAFSQAFYLLKPK